MTLSALLAALRGEGLRLRSCTLTMDIVDAFTCDAPPEQLGFNESKPVEEQSEPGDPDGLARYLDQHRDRAK